MRSLLLAVVVLGGLGLAADTAWAEAALARLVKRELIAHFKISDQNSDDTLDKEELAKLCRGPDAKPFDAQPPKQAKANQQAKSEREYHKYPDYQLLIRFDQDNDNKVSRREYESWAGDYAVEAARMIEEERRLIKMIQALELRLREFLVKQKVTSRDREAYSRLLHQLSRERLAYQELLARQRSHEYLLLNHRGSNRK
jgi:hypothetical protein